MPWSTLQNRSILSRLLADLHQGRTARIWVAGGGAGGDAPDPQASALGLPCGQPQPPAATRHFLHIHWPLATIRSPLATGLFALYAVLRYVERNPLRANLVERAQDWRWSSLGRTHPGRRQGPPTAVRLADPSTEELGLAGQPSRGQEGPGSGSPQRAARTALRQRAVVRTDRPEPGPRIHPPPSGPAPKDGSRALKKTPVPNGIDIRPNTLLLKHLRQSHGSVVLM